jgi:archaellum component FlaG (FlaF/FlaG flagellin family)
VNLGGWFLTDDFNTPPKYRLPDHTIIPANGYLVFTEAQFNPTPGVPPSFALNSEGDEVYLFSADAAGRLTGYLHGYSFGAAADGVSFGRHITSTGEEHFVAQRERTLGEPNAGPLVGPVVIGEIMYHPPAVADGSGPASQRSTGDEPDLEFIELQNNSSQPVPLYDPAFPTNTWRVRGAVSFDFPTNLALAPGAALVLVSFEPNTNAAARAAFLARYHVPTNVFLTGPYAGKLGNAAESVKLLRPEAPVATPGPDLGRVPYLLVEQVDYRQDLPWPTLADGYGASLQRRDPAAYGNDPARWAAAAPNPGAGFAGGIPPTIPSDLSDLHAVAGTDIALRVEAAGAAPLWYAWRWNGLALAGASNSVLRLTNVPPAQAGLYQAVVLNGAGAATSRVARLSVSLPAFITQQPQSRNALLGGSATLSVSAVGSGPLRYQWQFNGADLPRATNASLTLTNLQTADAGTYTVAIMDEVGSVTSQPALLQVLIKAAIVVQPQSQTAVQGDTVSLRIVATGTSPLSYRWRRNGVTVSGETNAVLTFLNVQTNRAGTYTCIVTNLGGSAPTSSNAVLTVLADTDGDHLPDAWEKQFGLNPNSNADRDLDPDGDGLRNWQEYVAGTDPTNALSYLKVETLAVGAGQPALQFLALSNRTYSMLYQDALAVTTWSKLADVPAQPTNRLETVVDPLLRTNRFYRLVTPALP